MSNYFLMFSLTSDSWRLTPAADQTGKLFVGDAVLQVGAAVRDSFALGGWGWGWCCGGWRGLRTATCWVSISAPLLFWQNVITGREGEQGEGKGFILLSPPHDLNQMSLLSMRLGLGAGDNIVVKRNRSESRHVVLNLMKQIAPRQTSAVDWTKRSRNESKSLCR